MPNQVRRKNKEPGDEITVPDLGSQDAEEIGIAGTTVGTEYRLTNEPDGDRQQDEAKKHQERKQRTFFFEDLDDL